MKRANDEVEGNGKKSKAGSPAELAQELIGSITDQGWKDVLKTEFEKPYFGKICETLFKEYSQGVEIFPPKEQIFNALNFTPLKDVKVVILGQDPYHDNGQAHGLCFSVQKGVKPPPSLKNIYKELSTDISGFKPPAHGYLESWARRGVLLMNATLTVQAHKANSHEAIGWQIFTQAVVDLINKKQEGVVFINFGKFAQKKCKDVDRQKHCVIDAGHPSPMSVKTFLGCKVFSKANAYLKSKGKQEIDWTLPAHI